ncbi:hypothetical protein C4D60_Mb06t18920 [Musa balbisiana]|uniref:Transcriptional coactivator p15 (PC4) C-terminal domain-containing protein n=1 Tax=Musa balbisiana TaxID=52838 RepID=A0A4V4H408_MUSBA|nr:hypothetical protein C4D60_Mb06t18920 [Musa balbisiana]
MKRDRRPDDNDSDDEGGASPEKKAAIDGESGGDTNEIIIRKVSRTEHTPPNPKPVLSFPPLERIVKLSNKRRVSVRKWKAVAVVYFRELYFKKGKPHPGKKGVSYKIGVRGLSDETPTTLKLILDCRGEKTEGIEVRLECWSSLLTYRGPHITACRPGTRHYIIVVVLFIISWFYVLDISPMVCEVMPSQELNDHILSFHFYATIVRVLLMVTLSNTSIRMSGLQIGSTFMNSPDISSSEIYSILKQDELKDRT